MLPKILESIKTNLLILERQSLKQIMSGWQSISEVGIVINAVPDITKTDTIPWEEWFMMENEIHHHVLFSVKHEKSTMTWQGEQDDKDHPKQVLGVLWHVYNDMSITPFLNQ